MQFIFLDAKGKTLFVRDDAERAEWTQEELTFSADFPCVPGKEIATGQRVYFRDPSTGSHEIYEIRQAKTVEPDAVQQITAENICVSELTDEHTDNKEIKDKTASSALSSVLSGTLWTVGTVETNPTSSVDISRGSVWQAVLEIRNNFNVYIEPRITFANGVITRKLDIKKTSGTWRGVRLSIDKNLLDPAVTIDDTNVATALYGYGGTELATQQGEENKEINFADVVWSKTSNHPAKPAGQKYLEDKEATAIYGRNGRPRFGYFQNTDILSPEVLLEKTWETLQTCNKPDVSVEGTVADLYRLGYADQPIRLHDIALVEVSPAGFKKQIQIIRMTTNLLDPSNTHVTIGAYIPNIVFIDKKINEEITGSPGGSGGSGGGGGGGGNKGKQTAKKEFETKISANDQMIELRAFQRDVDRLEDDVILQEAAIRVEHDRITAEVQDRREKDTELEGRITVQANQIGLVVRKTSHGYEVNAASIVLGINQQSGSYVRIQADRIDLTGYVTASQLSAVEAEIGNLTAGRTVASVLRSSVFYTSQATINSLAAPDNLSVFGHRCSFKSVKDVNGTTIHVLGY